MTVETKVYYVRWRDERIHMESSKASVHMCEREVVLPHRPAEPDVLDRSFQALLHVSRGV